MAYAFANASSQYLSTASTPITAYPCTIAAWCRPTDASADRAVVAINKGTSAFDRLVLLRGSDNVFRAQDFGASNLVAVGTTAVFSGTTYHTAAVFASNADRKIFLNGTQDGADTANQNSTFTASELLIGTRRASAGLGLYFSGDIAEVGIWSATLTAEEIASLADGMTCDKVRPQNLQFYAPLCRDLIDLKGRAITNNNTATVAAHPRVYA